MSRIRRSDGNTRRLLPSYRDVRRRLLTILIFLLAGAVVNTAVAWACAAYVDLTKASYAKEGRHLQWHVAERRAPGASRVLVLHWAANVNWGGGDPDSIWALDGLSEFGAGIGFLRRVFPSRLRSLPSWVSISKSTRRQPAIVALELDDARGWPMLALCCRISPQRPMWRSVENVHGGLALSPRKRVHAWLGFRVLPLHPIWSGFAVNTLLYAAVLWLLVRAPVAVRRRVRLKRGFCPACGYDLHHGGNDACPECGRAVLRAGT